MFHFTPVSLDLYDQVYLNTKENCPQYFMDYDSSRSEVWHQTDGKWNAILECQTTSSIKYALYFRIGIVHKLRWQDFTLFRPPLLPCVYIVYVWMMTKSGHFILTTYLPTSSCKRIYLVCEQPHIAFNFQGKYFRSHTLFRKKNCVWEIFS